MMCEVDCIQGDAAWFKNRLGCVTSSRISDVVAKRKKASKDRKVEDPLQCTIDMRWELVGELLSQKPTEHYVSRWMKEGKEKEPLARNQYEMLMNCSVDTIGFAYHPKIKMAGCSPDGLIGKVGLVEFKCPTLGTHLQYLADDKIPDEYIPQLVWQLAMDDEREWNDFVSFHPDLPEDYQIFRKRLNRTKEVEALIGGYEAEVELFNESVQRELIRLKESRARTVAEYALA